MFSLRITFIPLLLNRYVKLFYLYFRVFFRNHKRKVHTHLSFVNFESSTGIFILNFHVTRGYPRALRVPASSWPRVSKIRGFVIIKFYLPPNTKNEVFHFTRISIHIWDISSYIYIYTTQLNVQASPLKQRF